MALSLFTPSFSHAAADSDSSPLQGVRRIVLDNGLIVLIKSTPKSNTASVHLAVKAGSADESEWMGSGLSHYLEHMLFKGTATRAAGRIEEEVRQMGGSTNAYTSYDLTVYYLNVLASHAAQAVDLLKDVAFNATFPPDELERERQVILGEFRMNDDQISRVADVAMWKLLFSRHPYGVPVIGHRTLFEKVTREDLLGYHRKHYVPNNMVLTVVGNVDADAIEAAVQKTFGAAVRGILKPEARPIEPPQPSPRLETIYKPSQHARLVIAFQGVALSDPDAAALSVVAAILGQGDSSRLNQRLKETEQSVLQIESFSAALKDPGLFTIRSLLLPAKIDAARASILDEIQALSKKPVSQAELDRVKNLVLAEFYQGLETNDDLSHDLLTSEVAAADYRYSEVFAQRLRAVTGADIQRVASARLRPEAMSEVRLLPAELKKDDAQQASAAAPAGIERRKLSNGITLLLKRDPTLPQVVMNWVTLGGVRFESEETNGACALMAQLLTKGTANMGQDEVARQVEGWGGSIHAFSGQNSWGLAMSQLKAYTGDALALLSDLLANSAFDSSELEKAREHQLQTLLAKEEDIYATMADTIRRTIYKKHPYRLDPLGTPESVRRISRDNIVSFYKKTLEPRRSVLAVFGDFDPEEVTRRAEETLGRLASSGSAEPPQFEKERLEKAVTNVRRVPRAQAISALTFNSVDLKDPRRYAYEVLNAVMSGSAGRLYGAIRGREGLSYVVTSSLGLGIDPGYFVLFAAVEPAKAESTLQLLLKEADALRAKGITAKELENAKIQLLGDHERSRESKLSEASEASFAELYGMGFEEYLRYSEKVQKVSLEDVNALIREFLDPERSARILVGPLDEAAPAKRKNP